MTSFDLAANYHNNPESLLRRRVHQKTIHGQRHVPAILEFGSSSITDTTHMAEKTIREFSVLSSSKIPTGPSVNVGDGFELKPGVIHMVQASPFCGLASEDANSHLQQFLKICSTFTIKGATTDAVRLRLFPFSLIGKAKQWFYRNRNNLATWEACSNTFLAKYFPLGKTSSLRNRISSFKQLQEYITAYPHHGMEQWLIVQNFFHGLHRSTREYLDAAAGGSFLSLSVAAARTLIEKMASNQGWRKERANNKPRGVHQIDSFDMLAAKMDLLLKKLEGAPEAVPVQALDSRMTCEHCGNTGHTGNSCPENGSEYVHFINNNSFSNGPRPQLGWNSRPNLPFAGQGVEGLHKTPHPRAAGKEQGKRAAPEEDEVDREPPPVKEAPKSALHEFYDSTVLPFPQRQKKASVDDQFGKFVEVPTYAKYLKDILNNKKPLPSTEVVHLTDECSAAILNQPPEKKKDPVNPSISCSIGT
ncbi:hypothetical protein U9M48_003341 [Paspalum notatum var. saurae]|uniref:CCHC-type domain-containing protein n=1 Tax=Paspalum notatum var. saurae TaxID=547442 RepID=A0AAQ3PKW0_PASNO